MTVLPKQLKQPPAPSSFVDENPPQPAKNPGPWPFEHGQTYADHAGGVYRASVTSNGVILANLNKSTTWKCLGHNVGFVEGYFWSPDKPLRHGKYQFDQTGIHWIIELHPDGDISEFYLCRVEEKIIKLER